MRTRGPRWRIHLGCGRRTMGERESLEYTHAALAIWRYMRDWFPALLRHRRKRDQQCAGRGRRCGLYARESGRLSLPPPTGRVDDSRSVYAERKCSGRLGWLPLLRRSRRYLVFSNNRSLVRLDGTLRSVRLRGDANISCRRITDLLRVDRFDAGIDSTGTSWTGVVTLDIESGNWSLDQSLLPSGFCLSSDHAVAWSGSEVVAWGGQCSPSDPTGSELLRSAGATSRQHQRCRDSRRLRVPFRIEGPSTGRPGESPRDGAIY